MDLRLSDEEQLVVATFRRFADVEMRKVAADADRAGAPPAGFERAAREQLGVGPDAVPAEAGGLCEGAYSHLARALRGFELGRGCPALAALLEAPVDVALAVGRHGQGGARAVLEAIAAGGRAASASDGARRLSVQPSGDAFVVSGALPAVPGLDGASHLLLLVQAPASAVMLLDGESVQRIPIVPSAWRAAAWASATLSDVRVPAERVLARGDAAVREVLAGIRLSLAARAVGAGDAALVHAAAYANDRVQFGRPIGRFESLARMLDRGETLMTAARMMVLRAALLLDRAGEGDAARDAACDAVSRARDFTTEALSRVTVDAVQVHGGYGFVNDFPVEKLMRDARAFDAVTGDEAFERVLVRTGQNVPKAEVA